MQTLEEAVKTRQFPEWAALILINLASFGSVSAVVLLTAAADSVLAHLN